MDTKDNTGAPVSIRAGCLLAHKAWVEPNPAEVRAALKLANWSGEELSRRIGVDSRTVRRWTLGEKPINYLAWCVLCVQAGLGQIWTTEAQPPKCEKDGSYWLSKCDNPKWVVVEDGGPLWGIQKCENCGGVWTWGD